MKFYYIIRRIAIGDLGLMRKFGGDSVFFASLAILKHRDPLDFGFQASLTIIFLAALIQYYSRSLGIIIICFKISSNICCAVHKI